MGTIAQSHRARQVPRVRPDSPTSCLLMTNPFPGLTSLGTQMVPTVTCCIHKTVDTWYY